MVENDSSVEELIKRIQQLELETQRAKERLKQLLRKPAKVKSSKTITETPKETKELTRKTVDRYSTEIKIGATVNFLTTGGFQ